jgi:hypothetical protein
MIRLARFNDTINLSKKDFCLTAYLSYLSQIIFILEMKQTPFVVSHLSHF